MTCACAKFRTAPKSLRDLFHFLNSNYAKRHLYFSDSEGIRDAAEKITGADFHDFFARYVAGTDELPYDDFFRTVALKLTRRTTKTSYAGFTIGRTFGKRAEVSWVEPGSQAERAGLAPGDVVTSINGKAVNDFAAAIAAVQPGETVTMRVRGRTGDREVRLKVEARDSEEYFLEDAPGATNAQHARRVAWMRGDNEASNSAGASTGAGATH